VPHRLPGASKEEEEFAKKHGLPIEAVRGGAETMYPDYRAKLKQAKVAMNTIFTSRRVVFTTVIAGVLVAAVGGAPMLQAQAPGRGQGAGAAAPAWPWRRHQRHSSAEGS
jgi:hypothetical protein